jgi:dTDP-4-dehydrorhamnose reductase/dTDP-4-dehydrorhamnose 3,5-epimerase
MSDSSIEFGKTLEAHTTDIPGLVYYDLPVHGDSRGWFKENWQKAKMSEIGLPDFGPIQNNISYNDKKGVTRGIHAEPWDKYISIANGRIFGAWVDLREGPTFGKKFNLEMDPSKAIFVPRGVGNAFQTLEDNTVYTYLVNEHWSAEAQADYVFLNLADSMSAIDWPIPLDQAELSDKDKAHPELSEITPMKPRKILIVGANGQLGLALQKAFPRAEHTDRTTFDINDPTIVDSRNWRQYGLILNAAAYTAVDQAETADGRTDAWKANATALSNLVKIANSYNVTLVHVSSDYVFDGTTSEHDEAEPYSPLGVYGQTKAAGDVVVSATKKYYIVRSSWVIGEGNNFVRTMKSLADKGIKPSVVNDQIGRLTFTTDIAEAIKHLVDTNAPFGIYNVSGNGDAVSWANIASIIYEKSGHSPDDVTGVSTATYYEGKENISPRPLQSTLKLDKIESAGFIPKQWRESLNEYLSL